ncbi:PREDICTED: homeobox protein Hox-B3, partial [Myotis davidii]|uniref:homeobox protein Hox-B3 n=1 Tax=Myotis davidii TaxID=225400 RepID=UPI0007672C20
SGPPKCGPGSNSTLTKQIFPWMKESRQTSKLKSSSPGTGTSSLPSSACAFVRARNVAVILAPGPEAPRRRRPGDRIRWRWQRRSSPTSRHLMTPDPTHTLSLRPPCPRAPEGRARGQETQSRQRLIIIKYDDCGYSSPSLGRPGAPASRHGSRFAPHSRVLPTDVLVPPGSSSATPMLATDTGAGDGGSDSPDLELRTGERACERKASPK